MKHEICDMRQGNELHFITVFVFVFWWARLVAFFFQLAITFYHIQSEYLWDFYCDIARLSEDCYNREFCFFLFFRKDNMKCWQYNKRKRRRVKMKYKNKYRTDGNPKKQKEFSVFIFFSCCLLIIFYWDREKKLSNVWAAQTTSSAIYDMDYHFFHINDLLLL